jgi:hypothetical protein
MKDVKSQEINLIKKMSYNENITMEIDELVMRDLQSGMTNLQVIKKMSYNENITMEIDELVMRDLQSVMTNLQVFYIIGMHKSKLWKNQKHCLGTV